MRGLLAALLVWFGLAACARAEPLLADWAVLVVAADRTGSNGGPTEAFDNARRALSEALLAKGAKAEHLRQFSVEPARDPAVRPLLSEPGEIDRTLGLLTRRAKGGCLLYFTSHGDPRGIVMGPGRYGPGEMGALVDRHCPGRPTVVVVSACYSGVFLPRLVKAERLVLTAARPDRSSFGCGEDDHMPVFDRCLLQSLRDAADFGVLARQARLCVDAEERARRLRPPSEPQAQAGSEMRAMLPLLRFEP